LVTFNTKLPLQNFNNAEWIRRQWVEMVIKKCATEVQEERKKGRRGNKRPATDVADRAGHKLRVKVPELQNTTFMVVIHRVLNCNDSPTSSMECLAPYTDVRHCEQLIELFEKTCSPQEPYRPTELYKGTLT